jgi:DNA-binding transcriptional LysR family regulator
METKHMRYFLAIVDAGTFSAAAERLGIAQPALSQAMARMESALGAHLFTRSRRGAALTPAGQSLVETVRASLARIDAAAQQARQIASGNAGKLSVGFVATAVYHILPLALRAFAVEHPDVEIKLFELSNGEQARALERGEIDIAMLFTPVDVAGRMHQRLLLQDRLIAAVPDDFPVGDDGMVSLLDVARRGLVFAPYDRVPLLRAQISSAMRELGEEGRIVQEAHRIMTVLAFVSAARGASLLPGATAAITFPGVRFCDVRERELLPAIELSAVWRMTGKRSLVDVFAECLPAASFTERHAAPRARAGASAKDARPDDASLLASTQAGAASRASRSPVNCQRASGGKKLR